jgi:type VI secretion system protein ImpL
VLARGPSAFIFFHLEIMSAIKPMRRPVGYLLWAASLCILLLLLAVLMDDDLGLSRRGWMGWIVAGIAVLGMALFFLYGPIYGVWTWLSTWRFEPHHRGIDQVAEAPKRDARLQYLSEELRTSHGWRWRDRMPWLMLAGADERIEEVAPGLKQAGVMHVADTILVHAVPDGIEAALWRRQIRQLRRRRPVDGLLQVVRAVEGRQPGSELPRMLATITNDLGWAAPLTFLHAVRAEGSQPENLEPIGAFATSTRQAARQAAELREQLATLEWHTADESMRRCGGPTPMLYLARVSEYIGRQRDRIVTGWETVALSGWLRAPLAGAMFVPVFPVVEALSTSAPSNGDAEIEEHAVAEGAALRANKGYTLRIQPGALVPTWQRIGVAARGRHGRRIGFYWPNALAAFVTVAAMAWCAWMTVAFLGNQQLMREAQTVASAALDARPQTAQAWRAQLLLQQLMEKLEYRQQHGAPWYLRGGLSRNDDVLAALWPPYGIVATRNLQAPVVQSIEHRLKVASAARADALQSQDTRGSTYDALKTYLMLGDPPRAEPAFLSRLLVTLWPHPVGMTEGEHADTGRRLAAFYAEHLKAHPDWRITQDDSLVTSSRTMLVTQMGLASADDAVYQRIVDEAKGKYADASLEALLAGANARGLFKTSQTVPGIYTRAAWDGMIAQAIDRAVSERRVGGDWVLRGAQPTQDALQTEVVVNEKRAADELKERLTARYFAEYTAAWQRMLNSLQWQPAANLNGAIEQLTRLADAQTSPLIALMKAVQVQAQAGRPSQALTDTLVRKAQSLIGGDDQIGMPAINPLDKPFGSLLALIGDAGAAPVSGNDEHNGVAYRTLNGMSLSRSLMAVTTMRLKLQQIAGSADAQAMARSLAQAVFQGKLSELSQARDDAALTAASLGTAWAGFGDAVFAQPLEAAWQTILQPAAASLNEAWRATIAAPFNAATNGRYPFFETQADASFAELGRYVRHDTGLIARFIATQLAGVLKLEGDHWTPNELAPQALQFDPEFLAGVRQLSTVGAQLYLQGDAGERFEMMALPTPNVTRSELSVDGKQIVYFNQQESWTPLAWPGNGLNGHAGLTWQTLNAGLRQAFDSTGDWAFLRLLGKADVKPLDSTRYQLTWNAAHGEPLSYVLRTQLGAGPLELLKLRGFRMPERIFIPQGNPSGKAAVVSALPPLPPELQP